MREDAVPGSPTPVDFRVDRPGADISATEPDWSREAKPFFRWDPPRSLLASIRAYQRLQDAKSPWAAVLRRWAVVRHRWWSVVTGADIPINSSIGGGLLIPHPNGIVVHPRARIGPNCLLFQQVTIGEAHGGIPEIGGHVDVGAGAKILGRVRLGDHAVVGANAVVLVDVPAWCTAVGVPARVLRPHGSAVDDSPSRPCRSAAQALVP